jgi:hypothetical protein
VVSRRVRDPAGYARRRRRRRAPAGDIENQPSAADTSRSGFGNINISATYSFDLGDAFYLDMSAKVKVPTASVSKRLGTGLLDVTVGAELVKELGDWTVYAGARHRFNGSDARNDLRDVCGAGVGISYFVDSDWSLGRLQPAAVELRGQRGQQRGHRLGGGPVDRRCAHGRLCRNRAHCEQCRHRRRPLPRLAILILAKEQGSSVRFRA